MYKIQEQVNKNKDDSTSNINQLYKHTTILKV